MRPRQVYFIVLRKELRELLRDRRSLFWLFAPPIILPGLAICAALFIGFQAIRIAEDGFPVLVENGAQAPGLLAELDDADLTYRVDDPDDAVIVIELPDDFQQRLARNDPANIELISRDNALITMFARAAVRVIIGRYEEDLVDLRLEQQGLSRQWLDPITIDESRRSGGDGTTNDDTSGDDDDGGGNILATLFLPLAVTSWMVGGGIGLILDTTVGEKERQTIENLLVTPASRVGIVLGKLTVVFLASVTAMGLWMAEGVLLNAISAAGPELVDQSSLSMLDALEIIMNSGGGVVGLVITLLLVLLPFIVTLNGVVMAWCARAANYREANLFMVLMQLGLPGSILLTIFSVPASVPVATYAIPFFGTIVAIRDLFSDALGPGALAVNIISGIVYAALSVLLAAWVFEREWSLTRGLQ